MACTRTWRVSRACSTRRRRLTLAETASVFGETVTNRSAAGDARRSQREAGAVGVDSRGLDRHGVPPDRDEPIRGRGAHGERRDEGELSVERFGELWAGTQTAMLGDAVEVTEGYRTWWSYIPHFISTPGYVYAYAYGQLLALSVYRRYEERGDDFVPSYLELLRAGGSMPPEELGRIVGVRSRRSRLLGRRSRHHRAATRGGRGRGARRRSHLDSQARPRKQGRSPLQTPAALARCRDPWARRGPRSRRRPRGHRGGRGCRWRIPSR